jgi:hypothetical protein
MVSYSSERLDWFDGVVCGSRGYYGLHCGTLSFVAPDF